jgi:hypothetical protein
MPESMAQFLSLINRLLVFQTLIHILAFKRNSHYRLFRGSFHRTTPFRGPLVTFIRKLHPSLGK